MATLRRRKEWRSERLEDGGGERRWRGKWNMEEKIEGKEKRTYEKGKYEDRWKRGEEKEKEERGDERNK